jgi:hypothetical protein
MGKEIKQFKATEDDCVYFFDNSINRYRKICDIETFLDLPESIKEQIKEAKKEAAEIIKLPTA